MTVRAAVNKQLDSYIGGDIYRPVHPLRTFVTFYKWSKYLQIQKGDSLSLAKLTSSKYLRPHNISACWSSSIKKWQLFLSVTIFD